MTGPEREAASVVDCRHLIIGGGIIGCSIAYHLAEAGECDVTLVEKSSLTHGATWHAAGLVGQLRSSRNTTSMLQHSVALYDKLEALTGQTVDWKMVGSLRLACSPERMIELKRLTTMARSFDLEMHVISAAEARDLFPLIDPSGVLGAAYIPSDGHVDPASLCQAIACACQITSACRLAGVMNEALTAFLAVLDRYKLADIVANESLLRKLLSLPDPFIDSH